MSDEPGTGVPSGLPEGPPWSIDTLSDIHAGVYPPAMTAILRHQIRMDPESAAIFAALDSLTGDLGELSPIRSDLLPPMPSRLASRLDEALSAEVNARFADRSTQPVWPAQREATPTDSPEHRWAQSVSTPPPAWQTPDLGPNVASLNAVSPNMVSPNVVSPNVVSLDAVRETARRKRRTTWMAAIGSVAAAAVIGTVVVVGINGNQDSATSADSAAQSAPAAASQQAGDAAEAEQPPGAAAPNTTTKASSSAGSSSPAGSSSSAGSSSPGSTAGSSNSANATTTPGQPAPPVGAPSAPNAPNSSSSPSSGASGPPADAGGPASEFEIDLLVLGADDVADVYDEIVGKNVVVDDAGNPTVMADAQLGAIADPEVFAGCAEANEVGNDVLVGVRMALYEGEYSYAIALDDPFNPTLSTILVVGRDCGPDNADLLVRVPASR